MSALAEPADTPRRWLLRGARVRDLPALERLAGASAIGISSLPADRGLLREQLQRAEKAFASDDAASGEETYLFVLEDRAQGGELVGTSGIAAAAGFADRFFSYRNEFIVQGSAELGVHNRIHTLHLCHDLTGVSLLTGFHIDAALAHARSWAPQLLSRARLLFIAEQADRFSDRIAAENPGVAFDDGRCPFWDAVGRRFFGMDYPAAEALVGGRTHKALITGLMPQSPIYVPLLPEEAQASLGQLHPVGELPFSILMDEGFDGDSHINLFDGGPTAEGRLGLLKTVARRRPVAAQLGTPPAPGREPRWLIVANTRRDGFAALLLPQPPRGEPLTLDATDAQALGWRPGESLVAAALDALPH